MPTLTADAVQVPRRIVVCVDDVGLCDAVDQALMTLHALGKVAAGSVLVDGPSVERSAAALRDRVAMGLELGLHLNLTERFARVGSSAHDVRSLPKLLWAAYSGLLDPTRLRAEVHRQCERYVSVIGRPPDFIDGHQHVQQLPIVRDVLLEVLGALGWQPWLRCARAPRDERWRARLEPADRRKTRLLSRLGADALAAAAQRRGLRTNAHLLGVRRIDADPARFSAALGGWLAVACDADVLMVHPASHVCPGDVLGTARVMELNVLTGPEMARALQQSLVTIAPMRDIPVGADQRASA